MSDRNLWRAIAILFCLVVWVGVYRCTREVLQ